MSYMSKVWMAASVAVVNGHPDKAHKLKSGLKSIKHGQKRFISSGTDAAAADLRPLSGALNTDIEGSAASNETTARQADDSLRQVMYLNCWGQS